MSQDSAGNPGKQDVLTKYSAKQSALFEAAFNSGAATVKVDATRYIDLSIMGQMVTGDPSKVRSVIRV
jgi:hypothetical protein